MGPVRIGMQVEWHHLSRCFATGGALQLCLLALVKWTRIAFWRLSRNCQMIRVSFRSYIRQFRLRTGYVYYLVSEYIKFRIRTIYRRSISFLVVGWYIYKPHTKRYAAFAPIGAIATVFPFKWCWLFVHIAIFLNHVGLKKNSLPIPKANPAKNENIWSCMVFPN